ncbi:MAG TPA: phosphoesterase, partial [Myxococcaceae bacterium]
MGRAPTLFRPMTVGLVVCAAAFAFVKLADEVQEGETQRVDARVLRALRTPADPAVPIGPSWLLPAARDL